MLTKFQFTFATPNLHNGVTIYTPAVDDELIDAWIEISTAFNGVTPNADIGTFSGKTAGVFGSESAPVDATVADSEDGGAGYRYQANSTPGGTKLSAIIVDGANLYRVAPGRFTAGLPWKLVLSQDGTLGGLASASTAGAGTVYLLTVTPS